MSTPKATASEASNPAVQPVGFGSVLGGRHQIVKPSPNNRAVLPYQYEDLEAAHLSYPYDVRLQWMPFSTGYRIVTGSLPPGLSLDSSTGRISGTPTTVGTYQFTISAGSPNPPSSLRYFQILALVIFSAVCAGTSNSVCHAHTATYGSAKCEGSSSSLASTGIQAVFSARCDGVSASYALHCTARCDGKSESRATAAVAATLGSARCDGKSSSVALMPMGNTVGGPGGRPTTSIISGNLAK